MYLKKTVNYWLPVLIVLALVGATFLNLFLSEKFKMEDSFAARYTAAREWMRTGASPYSDESWQATQTLLKEQGSIPPKLDNGHFLDPVFYTLFYIPLSFIPYPIAKAIWMTIIELSILLIVWLSLQLSGLKLTLIESLLLSFLTLFIYPNFKMILSASILPFYLFLVVWAVWLAMNKQPRMAGVLFFIAFPMVPISLFIAVFFMIWHGARRDNSMLTVFVTGLAFLVVVGLILFPGWIANWLASYISLYPQFSWLDTALMRVGALFPGARLQISVGLHIAAVVYMLVEWYGLPARERRSLLWKLSLTLLLVYLLNPILTSYYQLLLWLPLFAVFRYLTEKWPVSGRIISWVVFLGVGVGHWIRFQKMAAWTGPESSLVILLLPAIIMIGLQYFRWWALKSSSALIESH